MPPTTLLAKRPAISRLRSALGLAGFLVLCFSAAAFGSQFMPGEWYAVLKKPTWNPPNWIFGPVWSALYTMMAVAAWLVWRRGGFKLNRLPLSLFLTQLLLNALWSWLFFGLKISAFAFGEIVLLWLGIGGTIVAFWPRQRAAAWLLVPYLLWVSFASVLNFTLWQLNR